MNIVLNNLRVLSGPLINVFTILTEKPPSSWTAVTVLPPIITLVIAYIALHCIHRVVSWAMTKSFFKRLFMLVLLGVCFAYAVTDSSCKGDMSQIGLLSSLNGVLECLSQPAFWTSYWEYVRRLARHLQQGLEENGHFEWYNGVSLLSVQ
ncbi:hypothetical protein EIP86_007852 [Pleurotus ostreatoroseus]|nr:hypothetical protein EIP86_007852 [Pleurotus ostreatoroseus]